MPATSLRTGAVDFIEAADAQFKVVEEKAFDEKGSAFQPSIRRGIQCAFTHTPLATPAISNALHHPCDFVLSA